MTKNGKLPVDVRGGKTPPERRFEEVISGMDEVYDAWSENDGRALSSLYRFLGKCFEAAPKIEADVDLRFELERQVKKHPDIKGKKAYKVKKKSVYELLLTRRLGTKAAKGRKSQWLTALKAAPENLEKTETAYIDWISAPDMGISGARRQYRQTLAKPRKKPLKEVVDGLPKPADSNPPLNVAIPEHTTFPEGYAVILAKVAEAEAGEPVSLRTVDLITDEDVIRTAAEYVALHPPLVDPETELARVLPGLAAEKKRRARLEVRDTGEGESEKPVAVEVQSTGDKANSDPAALTFVAAPAAAGSSDKDVERSVENEQQPPASEGSDDDLTGSDADEGVKAAGADAALSNVEGAEKADAQTAEPPPSGPPVESKSEEEDDEIDYFARLSEDVD